MCDAYARGGRGSCIDPARVLYVHKLCDGFFLDSKIVSKIVNMITCAAQMERSMASVLSKAMNERGDSGPRFATRGTAPFSAKSGSTLNGYRIGTYVAERLTNARWKPPEGFVEVQPQDLDLPITKHLTLADFVSHDGQGTVAVAAPAPPCWPPG